MSDPRDPDDLTARRIDRLEAEMRGALAADPLGDLYDTTQASKRRALERSIMAVDQEELRRVREAAAAAAAAQRLLDLHHLKAAARTVEGIGPVVLWADVERIMPLPQ